MLTEQTSPTPQPSLGGRQATQLLSLRLQMGVVPLQLPPHGGTVVVVVVVVLDDVDSIELDRMETLLEEDEELEELDDELELEAELECVMPLVLRELDSTELDVDSDERVEWLDPLEWPDSLDSLDSLDSPEWWLEWLDPVCDPVDDPLCAASSRLDSCVASTCSLASRSASCPPLASCGLVASCGLPASRIACPEPSPPTASTAPPSGTPQSPTQETWLMLSSPMTWAQAAVTAPPASPATTSRKAGRLPRGSIGITSF